MTPIKLKKERKKRAWTQFELEKKTGVSRYNISLLENGHKRMSREMAKKFREAFSDGVTTKKTILRKSKKATKKTS